ncbi:hypothetical protein V5F53_20565 [Xanthobacter sp. V4C-4]|uniref:hypothetical protein n=1 Tax=Xanthobacter cornucopiae TaxID=3119924 RepID=UPI003727C80B
MSLIGHHQPLGRALRRSAGMLLMLASLPLAAQAGPVEDFLAARALLASEVAAAAKAGESDDAVDKRNAAAIATLQAHMVALVGPVTFAGTRTTPIFMPTTLIPDYREAQQPDGLMFSSDDELTRVFVSPEPVFLHWLAGRARAEDTPPALRDGLQAAIGTEALYNAVLGADASFVTYIDLPVSGAAGETVNAALGLFTQTGAQDTLPGSIVVTRVAAGRVVVATAEAEAEAEAEATIKPLPACDKIWKGYAARARALIAAAERAKNDQDPRWQESATVEEDGAAAYRACFAAAAPGLPFFAAAAKQAEGLLAVASGQ